MYLIRRASLPWAGFAQYSPRFPVAAPASPLPLDIRQTEDAYVIEASVPGFTPEQVKVTVDQNWLVIQADRSQESEAAEGGWVRRERRSASAQRRLALPEEVDVENVSASFVNGELVITVPRTTKAGPRQVPLTTGSAETPAIEAPADTTPTA
jgi:HSP20 family protein